MFIFGLMGYQLILGINVGLKIEPLAQPTVQALWPVGVLTLAFLFQSRWPFS